MTFLFHCGKLTDEPLRTGREAFLRGSPKKLARLERGGRRIMYAIIENGNKQYRVSEGDVLKVEKLKAEVGAEVSFPVLMVADESGIKLGEEVKSAKVTATVTAQDKYRKIIVFKYKAKKNERKKQGHRQPFTAVRIEKISL